MKKYIKIVFCGVLPFYVLSSYCFSAGAENDSKEEITLPDVSTVISGGELKAGKSAVPDYSAVLPAVQTEADVLPQLPDIIIPESTDADTADIAPSSGKSVYAEGLAGGGFPGFFIGNFSIYRQSDRNPFSITFSHESANGYARNPLTSGYFDRNTVVHADKTFSTDSMVWKLSGQYESSGDGLQEQGGSISDVTKEMLSTAFGFDWNILNGFEFSAGADGSWYKRFSGITGSPQPSVPDYAAVVSTLNFTPHVQFGWGASGFSSSISAEYKLEHDLKESLNGAGSINRGCFTFAAGWKNRFVNIYGRASAVIGNEIGDSKVIVPFTAGIDFSVPTALSSRNAAVSIAGGLDSYFPEVQELEKKYKFSALSFMPSETSDWYGKLTLYFPVKTAVTVDFGAEFRKTALNNGIWEPDYNASDISILYGQYAYVQNDYTQVNTNAGVSMRAGIAVFSASWKAFWGDVPALETQNFVDAAVSLQGKNARWGFDGRFGITPDSNEDRTPVIDMSVFFRLTQAVRLAVSADDAVKLLNGSSRRYAGKYIDRSGRASVIMKFFF